MQEDKDMTAYDWEDEVRRVTRKNFWLGVLFGAPIWIIFTVITMMTIAVTANF